MENTSNNSLSFLMAKGPLSQIVLAFIMSVVLYIVLISLEAVYISYKHVSGTRTIIKDETVDSSHQLTYITNPTPPGSTSKYFRDIRHSSNERSGIEFSYSCFLLIKKGNYEDNNINAHRHIFHKGSDTLYPLMSPGVFVNAGTNTLRIYQNNTKTWYNYIDVNDIPIDKWFHLVVLVKDNATEVYINGNLAGKLQNPGSIIYQNYQDFHIFSDIRTPTGGYNNAALASIPTGEVYNIIGRGVGLISRLYYYSYALTYTEIQDLMNKGPNPIIETDTQDKPPYSIDNWWTGTSMLM